MENNRFAGAVLSRVKHTTGSSSIVMKSHYLDIFTVNIGNRITSVLDHIVYRYDHNVIRCWTYMSLST